MPSKRVVQGGLWYGSRTEKIEDHGYKNIVFSNHENMQVVLTALTLERVFEERKVVKGKARYRKSHVQVTLLIIRRAHVSKLT